MNEVRAEAAGVLTAIAIIAIVVLGIGAGWAWAKVVLTGMAVLFSLVLVLGILGVIWCALYALVTGREW